MNRDHEQNYLTIYSKQEYDSTDFSEYIYLKYLTIYDCDITELNPEIFKLKNLKKLKINDNNITNISGIGALRNLEELNLNYNLLFQLPSDFSELTNLKKLDLASNDFYGIPDSISKLENLTELYFGYNNLTEIPEEILSLKKLEILDLSNNRIREIPENINRLEALRILKLRDNYLKRLPESICRLNLEEFSFSKNKDLVDNYPECLHSRSDILLDLPEKGDKDFSNYESSSLYDKAESLVYGEKYEEALEILNKLLNMEQNGQALYSRGYCYLELGEYYKACDDFTEAIGIDGEKHSYISAKGVAHSRVDEYEEAILNHTKAISMRASVRNYENRALVYKDMGEYEKSIKDFDQAIELSYGENSELFVLRAAAFKRMGDLERSWEDLYKAVEVDPDHISTYLDTIEMFITTETYRKALEYIDKHENHIVKTGDQRDKSIFLYLKAIVYTCVNISIESFEGDLNALAKEDIDLQWYFGHLRDWLNQSELSEIKKDNIEGLTDLLEF